MEGTHNNSVGAGDSASTALRAGADTDDGDGAAGQAQEDVEIAQVDANGLEDGSTGKGTGLKNTP